MIPYFEVFAQYMHPAAGGNMSYWIIIGISSLASWAVGSTLKRRFAEYSQIPMPLTGAEIAKKMLQEHDIHDVQIISVPGQLTDHYDPRNKTVNLSDHVYGVASVAAAAVAAHECGHAIQHSHSYGPLTIRSKLVPVVSMSSRFTKILLIAGMAFMALMGNTLVLWLAVISMSFAALFAVVTLPVEFDASKKAMVWLNKSGLAGSIEHERAKKALFWAAMTYVVGALAAIGQLVYYANALLKRRG